MGSAQSYPTYCFGVSHIVSADHVLEQLRLIRAEKRQARPGVFLDAGRVHRVPDTTRDDRALLGTHTDILQEINDRLLALQRDARRN